MDMSTLWALNKQIIDPIVPRYTAVEKTLLTLTNVDKDEVEIPIISSAPSSSSYKYIITLLL